MLQAFIVIHDCGLVHADFKTDNAKMVVDEEEGQIHLELLDLSSACDNKTRECF